MTKKELVLYCNSDWPMCTLDNRGESLLNGSLNYYSTIQLELFCQWSGTRDKISFVWAFMSIHNKYLTQKKEQFNNVV